MFTEWHLGEAPNNHVNKETGQMWPTCPSATLVLSQWARAGRMEALRIFYRMGFSSKVSSAPATAECLTH